MRLGWSESRDCHKGWITDASKQHFFRQDLFENASHSLSRQKKKTYQIKQGIDLEEILCHMLDI